MGFLIKYRILFCFYDKRQCLLFCLLKFNSKNEIESLWKNNPHGGGIGLIDNDLNLKVPIRTHEYELFRDELQKLLKEKNFKTLVFHMRLRSKGSLDIVNVNPIYINEKTVMFHNGTINGFDNDFYSDTLMYVFNVLHSIKELDIENKNHIKQIKDSLLNNPSRLVFLQEGKAEPLIINNQNIGYWLKNSKQWSSK